MEIHGVLSNLVAKICLVEKQNKQIIRQLLQANRVEEEQNQESWNQMNRERSIQNDQERSIPIYQDRSIQTDNERSIQTDQDWSIQTDEVRKSFTMVWQANQERSIQRNQERKIQRNQERSEHTNEVRKSLTMERQAKMQTTDMKIKATETQVKVCSYLKLSWTLNLSLDQWK